MEDNVNVMYKNLPTRIKGFTSMNEYGDYLIIINSRLNDIQQREAYYHEVDHIEMNHFIRETEVNYCENSVRMKNR